MNLQVINNRIQQILAYSLAGLLFLLITVFLILQMPPVQNAIVGRILRNFSNVSGFTSRIDNFRLLWFDRLELGGLSVTDPEGNQMLSAGSVLINFNLAELLNQRDINVDAIVLDSAEVLFSRIPLSDTTSDLNINIFISELNKLSRGEGEGRNPRVNIGEAILANSIFTYTDPYRDSIARGFDYNHFTLNIEEGQIQNFLATGDTVQFDVRTLLLQDQKTGFPIHQLSTSFRISQSSMEFNGLYLKAGESFISDTVAFAYDSQRDLRDFINRVRIHARLDSTIIHPRDLAVFAPGTEAIGSPIRFSGVIDGRVRKFMVQDMDARINTTRLAGTLDLDGLPEISETFIILNLNNSYLNFDDLEWLFSNEAMQRLRPFGRIAMNGQFLGYPSDFVAHGAFSTPLGQIRSDINFKINEEDIDKSTYIGKLRMDNFDLGRYLGDTVLFQKVSLDGNLDGSGLTLETAAFSLNGTISSLGFKGYTYHNIVSDARFASQFFSGAMTINDPNLRFTAQGSVDLRENRNIIKVQATLDTAALRAINLSRRDIYLRSKLDVDIRGLELDSLVGVVDLHDFHINVDGEKMDLTNVHLFSEKEGRQRFVKLETTLFDALIEGDYQFSDLARDLDRLVHEMALNVRNQDADIRRYYAARRPTPPSYRAAFDIDIKDVGPLSDLLSLDLALSKNTRVEGSFTSGYTTIFRAFSHVDTIDYRGHRFLNSEAELTVSKIADSTNVLALAFFNSAQQQFRSGLATENLVTEGVWDRRHIDFRVDAEQISRGNYMQLEGGIDFMVDSTRIKFHPSPIHILNRNWHIEPENEIVVRGREVDIRNLTVLNRDQFVRIDGRISEDSTQVLNLEVGKLDLSFLDLVTNKTFKGSLNAEVQLSNYYRSLSVENEIAIDSLTVNDFLVGDVRGNTLYDPDKRRFNMVLSVDRHDERIVALYGSYTPSNKQPLDLEANLDQANLRILQPFLQEILSDINGTVSGRFFITGTLRDPEIRGEGTVANGQIRVNYTQALYNFTGIVGLRPEEIYFRDIELTDVYRNKGKLTGKITHHNFYRMAVDLRATFSDFMVLNTTPRDNSLFYGQGFATGEVRFTGPVWNMTITSLARTEKNTRIFIPIGGTEVAEKQDFINFVSLEDTLVVNLDGKSHADPVTITGVNLELFLDVTPDAYCEIIFDIRSGDIIRGRGNGDLKLQLDTKGEFNMFGTIEFTEGAYNFTLYDIINKEFEIEAGSRITWSGDPYGASLDIDASYNQLASFAPLVADNTSTSSPELRRKYPVQVLLNLEGAMRAPDITFDIVAPELPQTVSVANMPLSFVFDTFKNKLDEQELKRQVFSLIVLRKFQPLESFNTSGTLYNSVSELLSNQLSYWMSQVDENLEIDVDLGTMDQEAFNTFQLRLSYTFLNGRLRITRDGTFGNTEYNGMYNQNNVASVAGDWTVDYYLTADGKFKVKMYNRTNYNQLSTSVNNQYFTTGVSLQHVQSFNDFRDLIRIARKNRNTAPARREEDSVEEELNPEAMRNN
ncbi:MAG: translocation/assembly module TamB [Cyclobacteriaceae bacterium]|nr:translocation/assembly module TamB [Cyclobacteriaceae bacterium]